MSFQQLSPGQSSPTEDIVAPPITYLGVPLGAVTPSLSGHNVLTPAGALSSHKSLTHSQVSIHYRNQWQGRTYDFVQGEGAKKFLDTIGFTKPAG